MLCTPIDNDNNLFNAECKTHYDGKLTVIGMFLILYKCGKIDISNSNFNSPQMHSVHLIIRCLYYM